MKAEKAPLDTDREPNAPHPRETFDFIGHDDAEAALADALDGGRMHHAWLLSGPKGLGKSTLAYRFARAALGAKRRGPRPFDVDPEDNIARRIAAMSHPDLFIVRRGLNERGRPRREISAEEARGLGGFFSLAPAEGGMRIAIIDAVDDLNRHAANALLKTLEEPPPRAAILLVCHAPGGAHATIRSRCRRLSMRALDENFVRTQLAGRVDDSALKLARGRPGRAIALAAQGLDDAEGRAIVRNLGTLGEAGGRAALSEIYEKLQGEPFERLATLIELAGEQVRARAAETGSEAWAELWSLLETLRLEAEDLDMDVKHALAKLGGLLDRAASVRR